MHIEPSAAPAAPITSILMLQDALNLKLNLTVVSELRWRRDEPSSLHMRFEEADVKHVMDPHILSKVQLIGGSSYPFHNLKGANIFGHELGGANPLECDVGSAKKHFIINLEFQRPSALVSISTLPLLSCLKESFSTSQPLLQSSIESQGFWILDPRDP